MNKIVFATNNAHKLQELRQIMDGRYEIVSLSEIGCHDDIPETADTIEGNALIKARYVWERFHIACFSDDTGLEIKALDGEPGVYSARYSGLPVDSERNITKVLTRMQGITDRTARFRTAIVLIDLDGTVHNFEGEVRGQILTGRHGTGGFGYDSIFKPDEAECSFAEMDAQAKNAISHRGRAVAALAAHLHAAK